MSLHHDAQLVLACLDYTRLQEQDDAAHLDAFVNQLDTAFSPPAALCVYPQWLTHVRACLDNIGFEQVPLATVTNFPGGDQPLEQVLADTQQALHDGANEIDLVLPYRAMVQAHADLALTYVVQSKALCADKAKLKVIIESGELSEEAIAQACQICIKGGADFIKTSTGKVPVNATLAASAIILDEIKASEKAIGFKVSGGVKNVADAKAYLALAVEKMGASWVSAFSFRFGASSLLDDVYQQLRNEQ